ncbi:MAG: protein kinase domain-containing protein [Candidatus Zixiibacteriota bacterium]
MDKKTFSHYTIVRKLGSGGMASVYLADDNELPRQVALKLLPNQFIADKQLTERFFREARAAAKLEHPNIILIYEASIFEGQPFIAMQYIDGPTVAELISAKGTIEVEQSVSIICKVLETLQAAHEKGIFHRDIKPTNVMLKDGKYVRVIDFGIAKAQTDSNLTAAGTAFGTPAYMAPEQFSASPDANSALYDVYAVGVTFYYMLCGKLPFEGDNPYTIRDLKIYKKPVNPSSMASNIPPALDDVVMKAMAANPKDRYQSAQEMYDAIHNSLRASQTAIIDIREDAPVKESVTRGKKPKSKWPIAAAAGLALLIAGYFGYKQFASDSGQSNVHDTSDTMTVPVQLAAPVLFLPSNGSTISASDKPEFGWTSTAGAEGSYLLEYSQSENFSQLSRYDNLKDTVYNPPTGLDNGTYFWRVQGKDKNGGKSDFSRVASFVLNKPAPPTIPEDGIISITINEPSTILVDGKIMKANATSWEGNVEAGRRLVRLENQSSVEKSLEERVTVNGGERVKKSFNFSFPQVSTELVVVSPPFPANVFVDGKDMAVRTPTTLTIQPGSRTIKVVRVDNGQELSEKVTVEKGTKRTIRFDFATNTAVMQ